MGKKNTGKEKGNMVTEEKETEILEKLKKGVIEFDEDLVRQASEEGLEVGMEYLYIRTSATLQ